MKTQGKQFFWEMGDGTPAGSLASRGRKSLFCGIARPTRHASVPDGTLTGPKYLFYTLGLFAVVPTVLINGLLSVIQLSSGIFDFNDINPHTIAIGHPIQFLLAFFFGWVFSWTLYAGTRATGAATADNKGQVRALGWVIVAAVFSLIFWWFGFGVPTSILLDYAGLPSRKIEDVILGGGAVVAGILSIRLIVLASWATLEAGIVSSFFGTLIGVVLWLLAVAPILVVLQGIALGIALGLS